MISNSEMQSVYFDQLRDEIHQELDAVGIGEVLAERGVVLDTAPYEPFVSRWMQELLDKNLPPEELPGNFQYHVDKLWRPYKGRTKLSRFAVGVAREYTSQAADMYPDLDPLAHVMAIGYEVGVVTNTYREGNPIPEGTSQQMMLVVDGRVGETKELTAEFGIQLNFSQIAVIEGAVRRLQDAKRSGGLRFLTKSLIKIDSAGD